jgi:HlyD family secretion protein
MRNVFFATVLAAQLLSGVAFAQTAETPDATAAANAPTISVMVAAKKKIAEELVVTGSFAAGANVLVSPLVNGYAVVEILAEEGDTVKEGQVLARLDGNDVEILLAQSAANLAKNDAAVLEAKNKIKQAKIAVYRCKHR